MTHTSTACGGWEVVVVNVSVCVRVCVCVQGKLCVLLDLDGTLVSSFTPKRAPRLPSYIRTHIVGMGSKLNPQVRTPLVCT